MIEPIELEFTEACSSEHAFEVWAAKTSLWWPHDHSVSGEPGFSVTFEPRPGGRIFERTAGGVEHDWGKVLTWEPPRRITYLWHIGSDRTNATKVDITFTSQGDATIVTIVHRGWERLGAAGADRRQLNQKGWVGLLPHFVAACAGPPS
ncbi:MAG: SRPBCC domain-containing protein [Actinobacteria bacterium]|nr:SRPBCC domain-containing protein [Actinomycetota bacterium]MDQ3531295.1 SRPBCC domain-containing protein [Actinomycetota bacterium]